MTPLRMALWERERQAHPPTPHELIHHSDAGSQYTSVRLTEHLAFQDILPSIGTVGDAYDNALMESINGLYMTECIRTTVFGPGEREYKTLLDVELATAAWVHWYNHDRLHTSLEMHTPVEHENAHYAALNREQSPVSERHKLPNGSPREPPPSNPPSQVNDAGTPHRSPGSPRKVCSTPSAPIPESR